MSKKPSKQEVQRLQKRHQIIMGLSVIVAAILIGVVLSLMIIPKVVNDNRLQRINAIYASIEIDGNEKYFLQNQRVFGDKRPYEYDSGRSYSSEKNYIRAANVDVTVKELDTAVKAAGFTFVGEPYPGSTYIQYHYKSAKGEYVRISVSSKVRDDAFQNSLLMTGNFSEELYEIDPNAGPSNVVIKVNLDDNNE